MKKFLAVLLSLSLLFPLPAIAADQADLLRKIEALSKELDSLKQQMQEMQKKDEAREERITVVEKKAEEAAVVPGWLEIGGDFRSRFDYLKGETHNALVFAGFNPATGAPIFSPHIGETVKNEALMTNRLGINLRARATEDVHVKARFLMYKVWGHSTEGPIAGGFFADRMSVFDGITGHVPKDNILRVDQAYATWSNIADQPVWFSVGRRPSTGGIPSNLRANRERIGTAGVPALLVDYAFDGLTLGVAPYIEALPGAYAKFCFGKGFDSGYERSGNTLKDTYMLGISVVPYDTDNLNVELNMNKGTNIFAMPEIGMVNVGDIDWYGATVMGKINDIGAGDINLFISSAISKTDPNNNTLFGAGLMWDPVEGRKSRTGYAVYLGARYDIEATGTKIGAEYNHGTKNWITFAPASDDIWTAKLGTRGNVYEAYIIQELKLKPIAKRGKAFFRLGYQHYDFNYTGSNNWIGAPHKITSLTTAGPPQFFTPLENAQNIYLTFDVTF
jgi:hypothetical protein